MDMDCKSAKAGVSVVILNWNGEKMLEKYLPDVVKYSDVDGVPADVWVIDNASTDNSVDLIKRSFPMVRLLLLDRNYGFAGGYNKGLEQIDSDYLILLNSDVRVTDGWLAPVIRYMENNPEVAVCQPKLMSDRNTSFFEYAGAAGGYIDKYGYPFCRGRVFSDVEEDHGQYDDVQQIFWASGAALFVRTEVFKGVGGFDESFFAHMEEIDLCWRIRNSGYKIMYIPSSVVYHVGAATLKKENPFKTYLNFRNNLYMLYKNLPDHCFRKVMFIRVFLDFVSFMMFVLTFKFDAAAAVFKARRDYVRNRHKYVRQAERNNGDFPVKNFSIVFNYYILRRKTYDKLPL